MKVFKGRCECLEELKNSVKSYGGGFKPAHRALYECKRNRKTNKNN